MCFTPLVLALALGQSTAAAPQPERLVAVTFDDLPAQPREAPTADAMVALSRAIVGVLRERGIPAVGFVNEDKLRGESGVDRERVRALEVWLEAGLELGNHTYSHPSLHRTALAAYLDEIERGEAVTRELLAARGSHPRWFRHPFLHTGRDLETKRAVEAWLTERGLRVAPVTIDNAEWIFARAYLKAREGADEAGARRIADEYVVYMERKTEYWERQSVALFGREIPQVLLVHANRLNADHFARVADMLSRRGYRYTTLERAVEDDAYDSTDTFTGGAGISWLHRWALSGRGRVLPDEPRTPAFVMAAAGVEAE